MQTPTTQVAEQAIAKIEAEEHGIDTSKQDKTDDQSKDAGTGKPTTGDSSKSASDTGNAETDQSKSADTTEGTGDKTTEQTEKEEGKYTADDALEVEDQPGEPQAPTDNAGIQLSPAEQKYIADNIGEPIVIRGMRGEGDNAREVEIKAYSPADIPADFKFANDRELVAAQNGFQSLENKATSLLGNYRQNQSQQAARDFERRENEGIRADVADLQKEGRFPKFTVQPGADGFDDSPEAKQMAEVLQIMSERNDMYMKQYQQGRPYKHIGFAEAFELWEKTNPQKQAEKQADADQQKEDDERKTRNTERSANNRGMSSSNIVKPTVRPGTTTRDILARIDAEF